MGMPMNRDHKFMLGLDLFCLTALVVGGVVKNFWLQTAIYGMVFVGLLVVLVLAWRRVKAKSR